jgi:hypothetical protein
LETIDREVFQGGSEVKKPKKPKPGFVLLRDEPKPQKIPPSVPERLAALGQLNLDRGKNYGRFDRVGHVLHHMFPNGLLLSNPQEFNRLVLFIMMINKLVRLSTVLPQKVQLDTLDDVAVYSMIMQYHEDDFQ